MKRLTLLGFIVLVAVVVIACTNGEANDASGDGGEEAARGETYSLNVGIVVAEDDPIYAGLTEFKKNVEERTDGNVAVTIYPNSQLGDMPEIQEQAMSGANVGTIADAGIMADFVPDIGILQGPYLFDNYDEIKKVTTSDLFQSWADELAQNHNLQILSMNWYQGDRHMITNKPIRTPDDLNGLSIRTIGADVFLKSVEAMGANPTGLDWAEVYPGIQQGVIDGAEAQHPATHGASLYEVADYISKTSHFQLITGLVVSADWFNNLPQEYQDILVEEAIAGGDFASQQTIDMLDEYEKMMEEEGMEIVEVDVEPFKEATEGVYEQFDGFVELRQQIHDILGK